MENLNPRHSGAGRNPVKYKVPCAARTNAKGMLNKTAGWPYLETRRQRLVLSASQNVIYDWIPAFAGMTA
jgi:hypothetical protein